jgi:hypothetical protein
MSSGKRLAGKRWSASNCMVVWQSRHQGCAVTHLARRRCHRAVLRKLPFVDRGVRGSRQSRQRDPDGINALQPMHGLGIALIEILPFMHHNKADRAENTLRAIGVMTAYYAEDNGTALVSKMATEYANEPNGLSRLIDGFVHMSARMIMTFEAAGVPRDQVLQTLAEDASKSGLEEA